MKNADLVQGSTPEYHLDQSTGAGMSGAKLLEYLSDHPNRVEVFAVDAMMLGGKLAPGDLVIVDFSRTNPEPNQIVLLVGNARLIITRYSGPFTEERSAEEGFAEERWVERQSDYDRPDYFCAPHESDEERVIAGTVIGVIKKPENL